MECILYAHFVSPNGFYSVYSRICFSEWYIVPLLCIQIKQSRVYSRKALSECKASRRLGKQMRCFYRFLSKPIQHFLFKPISRSGSGLVLHEAMTSALLQLSVFSCLQQNRNNRLRRCRRNRMGLCAYSLIVYCIH